MISLKRIRDADLPRCCRFAGIEPAANILGVEVLEEGEKQAGFCLFSMSEGTGEFLCLFFCDDRAREVYLEPLCRSALHILKKAAIGRAVYPFAPFREALEAMGFAQTEKDCLSLSLDRFFEKGCSG